jgi:NADH-quinone oxidoreductase subunit J
LESAIFYFFSAVSVVTALVVAASRRPAYGALALIVCLLGVAGLYAQLGATFVAAVQIIVYAGAVLIVFLLVIMLLGLGGDTPFKDRPRRLGWAALPVGLVLVTVLGTVVARTSPAVQDETMAEPMRGTAARLGEFLLTDYLAPFEATAILILVSLVGATWLVRR